MSENPGRDVYLQPDFEANSLKVAQLRGILHEHGVTLPQGAKKPDLVKAFQENVQAHAPKLRASASKVKASNRGIVNVADDGTESVASSVGTKRARGRPRKDVKPEPVVEETEPPPKRPRGRPRKTPLPEDKMEVEVEAPKRARSRSKKLEEDHRPEVVKQETPVHATRASGLSSSPSVPPSVPSAPSSSRRHPHGQSSVSVTSEMQPILEPVPEKPTPRAISKRKSQAMLKVEEDEEEAEEAETKRSPKSPKRQKTPRKTEPSVFSDYNPFQSGSEEAADIERRRRKSSAGLSVKKAGQPRRSEPGPGAGSMPAPSPGGLRRMTPSRESMKTPPKEILDAAKRDKAELNEEYNRLIEEQIDRGPTEQEPAPEVSVTSHVTPKESIADHLVHEARDAITPWRTLALLLLSAILLPSLWSYRNESAYIGYCDTSSSTNDIILTRQSALDEVYACIDRRTAMNLDNPGSGDAIECDASALPLIPFRPRPTTCTPCPQHAVCEDGKLVACEPEYLFSPSLLAPLSTALNGLPKVGPVAFPPSCKPDTQRKKLIGSLAAEIEADLAKGRGAIVCAGMGGKVSSGDGETFGMEERTLHDRYLSRKSPKITETKFEEIFAAALADLVAHDDVIESIDVNGHSWYAASRTDLTMRCKAKMETIRMLEQWKRQLISTIVGFLVLSYIGTTMKHRYEEKIQAEELASVALKRLRDQEHLHYSDPVTNLDPFLAPDQLRDLVMPPSGSATHRTRLWNRVQELVEANANVSVRDREVRGEIWKTWEWGGVADRHIRFE